jgi:hypothetical protein
MRKEVCILSLILFIVALSTQSWGLEHEEYEEKFNARGKQLLIDWGVFESLEERERLEEQLGILWKTLTTHRDDFRLTKRIEITRSTGFFSLSDEIQKDNDLLRITLSRSGNSTLSEETILKTLRSKPFLYYTKETLNYRERKVVRDLGRDGYYYKENGEMKYAAVDTVDLFEKQRETEKGFEEQEKKEKERELYGE